MANPQPTESHLRIAHSLQEEIMMRDFTKRQRSILDLILRLSWGCGKKTAIIPKQKDFELVGISETKIRDELTWLVNARVIAWDKSALVFSFNKDYDQWKVSIVPGYDKERLASLIHMNIETSQNSKNTSQNGNFPKREELPEKGRGNFPKKQVFEPAILRETSLKERSIESIIESNNSLQSKTKKVFDVNSQQYQLAILLRNGILKNLPKARVPDDKSLAKWADVIDKLIRLDKRTPEEIRQVIDFAVADEFWSANILSASSLRKQFDRLMAQMKRSKKMINSNPRYTRAKQLVDEGVWEF